ncbi:hypothetical protein OU995_01210 [Roseateles sp. SL47]|uniref:hypothetical protein n=1 Tax=Roseateles sp. SL47 TaxID=2995138 RepID=UPI0022703406|nr:hypothetical protein [Roseateles sp. SL47]WAC73399.1 hypothetical protein OU995_01210 [Roseateles sp. SL47]
MAAVVVEEGWRPVHLHADGNDPLCGIETALIESIDLPGRKLCARSVGRSAFSMTGAARLASES